ncbi:ATP-binding cassette domain-containing protein [uncultured Ilyobacter sp.]|uniref:ATP-binding cassette domain-containing protein n=1 Tax=uncultured Ilyobacter sp. TaxID=544433 RepID=UPI0037490416
MDMLRVKLFKEMYNSNLDIDFAVDKEVLAIQGASGAGKSTLLECISGLQIPDRGQISIRGDVVYSSDAAINTKARHRKIGYVFQNYALFPHMSVKENICFGMKCRGIGDNDYVDYLMKTLKIKHLEKRHPGQISGGEKQRVALVRALATKPEVLLLDEPFSALDQDTKDIVYEEFLKLKNTFDMSIILVTHNQYEAEALGDRILKI